MRSSAYVQCTLTCVVTVTAALKEVSPPQNRNLTSDMTPIIPITHYIGERVGGEIAATHQQ